MDNKDSNKTVKFNLSKEEIKEALGWIESMALFQANRFGDQKEIPGLVKLCEILRNASK